MCTSFINVFTFRSLQFDDDSGVDNPTYLPTPSTPHVTSDIAETHKIWAAVDHIDSQRQRDRSNQRFFQQIQQS